nr:hypothetical protein [uncultured Desulfobacter sp.]
MRIRWITSGKLAIKTYLMRYSLKVALASCNNIETSSMWNQ